MAIEFVNLSVFSLVLTFIGTLAIGLVKAYERITNPDNPENWDKTKFGLFVVVVAVIMLIEYATTGVVQFPADDLIQIGLQVSAPIFGLFGLAYSTIMAGSLVKRDVVVPIVASIKESAAAKAAAAAPQTTATSDSGWSMGFTVTPTYRFGKSPLNVNFEIYATVPTRDHPGVISVDIDWADGNKQLVPMVNGEAQVQHTFTFVKNDKYTGHTFYPIFAFNGNDGSKTMFNVDGKGVEIWVESL